MGNPLKGFQDLRGYRLNLFDLGQAAKDGEVRNLIYVLQNPPSKPLNLIAGCKRYSHLSQTEIVTLAAKHLASTHIYSVTTGGVLIQPK